MTPQGPTSYLTINDPPAFFAAGSQQLIKCHLRTEKRRFFPKRRTSKSTPKPHGTTGEFSANNSPDPSQVGLLGSKIMYNHCAIIVDLQCQPWMLCTIWSHHLVRCDPSPGVTCVPRSKNGMNMMNGVQSCHHQKKESKTTGHMDPYENGGWPYPTLVLVQANHIYIIWILNQLMYTYV